MSTEASRDNLEYSVKESICPDCGGERDWCAGCGTWAKICCEEYPCDCY